MPELDILLQKKLNILKREYPRALNRDLAQHQSQQLFSRNVVALQEKLLKELEKELPKFEYADHELKPKLMNQVEAFIQSALTHNRSSCAISNFPEEHNPAAEYIGEVLVHCESMLDEFVAQQKEINHA